MNFKKFSPLDSCNTTFNSFNVSSSNDDLMNFSEPEFQKCYQLENPMSITMIDSCQISYFTKISNVEWHPFYFPKKVTINLACGMVKDFYIHGKRGDYGFNLSLSEKYKAYGFRTISINGFDIAKFILEKDYGYIVPHRTGFGIKGRNNNNFLLAEDFKKSGAPKTDIVKRVNDSILELMNRISEEVKSFIEEYSKEQTIEDMIHLCSKDDPYFVTLEFCYDQELPQGVDLKNDKTFKNGWLRTLSRINEAYSLGICNVNPTDYYGYECSLKIGRKEATRGKDHKVKMYKKYCDNVTGNNLWRLEVAYKTLRLAPSIVQTHDMLFKQALDKATDIFATIANCQIINMNHLEDTFKKLGMTDSQILRVVKAFQANNGVIVNRKAAGLKYNDLKRLLKCNAVRKEKGDGHSRKYILDDEFERIIDDYVNSNPLKRKGRPKLVPSIDSDCLTQPSSNKKEEENNVPAVIEEKQAESSQLDSSTDSNGLKLPELSDEKVTDIQPTISEENQIEPPKSLNIVERLSRMSLFGLVTTSVDR